MACGKPTVASDADGIRDSLRNGIEGFLAAPGDIDTFAQKLLLLIGDAALRKQMGEAGRARASEFSEARTTEEYLALISEALAQNSS
jgi:glycosyltransferase involved in cell wall biosynthesis